MQRWQLAIERLEGAYAPATLTGYRRDFSAFEEWCETRDLAPLPATAPLIARFLQERLDVCSALTLKRRVAAIRKVHRLMGMSDPTEDEEIAILLRRAKRSQPRRPRQALGLTRERRDRLIAACGTDLIGRRNRAIVAVGYDTLCRQSELVALRVEDLERRPRDRFSILVRRAKNDPFGLGRIAWISAPTAVILQAWLEAAGHAEGPLFRPVRRDKVAEGQLKGRTVALVLKRLAQQAGLPPQEAARVSGHSLRVGAAQDLMTGGKNIATIMQAGGWKSRNVVSRYIEHADPESGTEPHHMRWPGRSNGWSTGGARARALVRGQRPW